MMNPLDTHREIQELRKELKEQENIAESALLDYKFALDRCDKLKKEIVDRRKDFFDYIDKKGGF